MKRRTFVALSLVSLIVVAFVVIRFQIGYLGLTVVRNFSSCEVSASEILHPTFARVVYHDFDLKSTHSNSNFRVSSSSVDSKLSINFTPAQMVLDSDLVKPIIDVGGTFVRSEIPFDTGRIKLKSNGLTSEIHFLGFQSDDLEFDSTLR